MVGFSSTFWGSLQFGRSHSDGHISTVADRFLNKRPFFFGQIDSVPTRQSHQFHIYSKNSMVSVAPWH
jgi:hypothetical protein